MIEKEWRNHTDERIAALFAAMEENSAQMITMFTETNRRINESQDRTQEQINLLLASQIKAEQRMDAADKRMDRLEENINRVINKVDSWLDSL